MIQHSDAMMRMMAADPVLAARVAHWDACGVYVRVYLASMLWALRRGAL